MGRKKLIFVGKGNPVNSELFQALEQGFTVSSHLGMDSTIVEAIQMTNPSAIVISLIGMGYKYYNTFELLKKNYPDIPVVTIGTEYECDQYASYYKNEQFHKVLRPISGEEVLAKCNEIVGDEDGESKRKQPHILIVDDNAMVLRNVKALLEDKYSVAVAASGSQAFVSMGKKKPDLILLDYEMPMLDGQATLEMIQANEDLKDIPVIFLTSVSTKEVVTKLLALKPAGYVLKPVEKEALVEKIEIALGK